MKLSQQQLEALVSTVYERENSVHEKEYTKKKKELETNKANIALAKKYCTALNSIPEKIRKELYIDKGNESEFLRVIIKLMMPKNSEVSRQSIRDRILIASIESETLTQLQSKLHIKL